MRGLGWARAAAWTLGLTIDVAAPPLLAGEPWVEVRSPHFLVRSDAGEKEARRTAWQFEQIRGVFAQQWRWARLEPGRPLVIIALKDERSFTAFLPAEIVRNPKGFGGVFVSGPDRYYLCLRTDLRKLLARAEAYYPNPYQVVYHEYVHLLQTLNFAELPAWLSEGLAEYWGATEVDDDDLLLAQPLWGHVRRLRSGFLPMETLLALDRKSVQHGSGDTTSTFYAQSWALVHFLFNAAAGPRRDSLNLYLSDLRKGVPEGEARKHLPSEAELSVALGQYVLRNTLPYHKGPAPEPPRSKRAYKARTLAPAESALVRVAFLARHGPLESARAAVGQALGPGALQAELEEARGILAFREGAFDEAERHLARALELDSKNAYILFKHAHLLQFRDQGPATLDRMENELTRALQLDPGFAPAWGELALVVLRRGRPPETAKTIVRKGLALEPGDSTLRAVLQLILDLEADQSRPARETP